MSFHSAITIHLHDPPTAGAQQEPWVLGFLQSKGRARWKKEIKHERRIHIATRFGDIGVLTNFRWALKDATSRKCSKKPQFTFVNVDDIAGQDESDKLVIFETFTHFVAELIFLRLEWTPISLSLPSIMPKSIVSDNHLKKLRDAISVKPPYCSGVYSLSNTDSFTLYYGKQETGCDLASSLSSEISTTDTPYNHSRRVDLLTASDHELELLSKACQPATFGVNQQDIHDESYRKAGKLDASDFAAKFNLERSGLLEQIYSHLLEGHDEKKTIEAELYKLNVYGTRSITPRPPHFVLSNMTM